MKLLFSILSLFVFITLSCNKNQKESLAIAEEQSNTSKNRELTPSFEMRCNCPAEPYRTTIQTNEDFADRFDAFQIYLKGLYAKSVDSIDAAQMHTRIQTSITGFQQNYPPALLIDIKNWLGYGALKVFFLRKNALTSEEKLLLGLYVDMLVEVKNANLPELVDALEKLENFWSKSKIIATAQAILTNYNIYNADGFLDVGSSEIEEVPSEHNEYKQILLNLMLIDNQAKGKMQEIITRNQ